MQRVQINQKYQFMASFVEGVPEKFEHEGSYIYGGKRNLIKRFITPEGQALIVKRFGQKNPINRIVYSLGIRKPKGQRAFEYPYVLLEKGIDTPEAVAYIEERDHVLLNNSYLFSIECTYSHRLYELKDATPDVYEPLAVALAHFTAYMHDQHVLHLDYSPGNILWDKDGERYKFSIVDINRMHFGDVNMYMGCKNFERLTAPEPFFRILAHEYAKLRGFDTTQAEKLILDYNKLFHKRCDAKKKAKSMREAHSWLIFP